MSNRPLKIIRRRRVEEKTGLGHSSIYEGMSKGTFPRQMPLGAKAVGWLEQEIDDWILKRIAERDNPEKRRAGCDAELALNAAPSLQTSRLQSKPHRDDEIGVEDRPNRKGR